MSSADNPEIRSEKKKCTQSALNFGRSRKRSEVGFLSASSGAEPKNINNQEPAVAKEQDWPGLSFMAQGEKATAFVPRTATSQHQKPRRKTSHYHL